jgi:hypothetical protein
MQQAYAPRPALHIALTQSYAAVGLHATDVPAHHAHNAILIQGTNQAGQNYTVSSAVVMASTLSQSTPISAYLMASL